MSRRDIDRLPDILVAIAAIDTHLDELAHRWFDQEHGIVGGTVHDDLPVMRAAVVRLLTRLES